MKSFQVGSLQIFIPVPALIWFSIKDVDNTLESIHLQLICR